MTGKISEEDLFQGIGISEVQVENMVNSGSQHVEYAVHGRMLNVEICAPNMAAAILSLTPDLQKQFFKYVLGKLPEIGDQLVITSKGNKRGARVVRLKSELPEWDTILMTR